MNRLSPDESCAVKSPPTRFCAKDSAAIGDPLVGTAAHPVRNLLISWPRVKWGRNLRKANDMPNDIVAAVDALAEAGRRVNLIHRRGQASHEHRIFLMPERQAFTVAREELPLFLNTLLQGSVNQWCDEFVSSSLILCCTHGRKDKCCAKFGYRTYKDIAETVRHHELPFDVWESTHLGGCRLAASAIVFPQLRKYGRIGHADVLPLLRSEAGGRPYLPCYRGDSRLTPPQQCAEVATLKWLSERGITGEVTVEGDQAKLAGNTMVLPTRWRSKEAEGHLRISCQEIEVVRHDTCADYNDQPATPSKIWKLTDIRPVPTS